MKPVIAVFKNHYAVKDSGLKNWLEICYALSKPLSVPKEQTPCWAAQLSGLKTKAEVLDWGEMSLLWIDRDTGNSTLDSNKALLDDLGITSYGIHSTFSSTDEDKRWRILIEIKEYMTCEWWLDLQEALQILFNSDTSAIRVQQIMYAPNRGQHYEYYVSTGIALDSTPPKMLAVINDLKAKRAVIYEKVSAKLASRPSSDGFSIKDVNNALDTEILLENYGYKRKGRKWVSPGSASGRAGLIAFSDGRWYSHHTSDHAIGLPLNRGEVCGDAFDLYVHYEHGGNRDKGLACLAASLDPEANKKRQLEWVKQNGGAK